MTRINLENITLSQGQKHKRRMICLQAVPGIDKLGGTERKCDDQGPQKGGPGNCFKSAVSGMMKRFWIRTVVVSAQYCEGT